MRRLIRRAWLYAHPHTLVTTYGDPEGRTILCAWRQWGRRVWNVQRGQVVVG